MKQTNKLWQKDISVDGKIESFTIGMDNQLDLKLAKYDVLGSMAHITMLQTIGLLSGKELETLKKELRGIYRVIESDNFQIESGVEDVHSQVELLLTRKLGDIGKKIHAGRSRNDQVLLDLKLFMREEIRQIVELVERLTRRLLSLSEQYKHVLMPGYTHMQVAMVSSFGLWFGAFSESLVDDLHLLKPAFDIVNRNPLGSAAGYGSSFPLNRQLTTDLLGFESMNYNVVYAQMGRGKAERVVSSAMSNIADTLSRLAMDICVYMGQNHGFVQFPDNLTTGSSIMPHKKNPDVFELIRAKCNQIKSLPNEIMMITANLPTGYHRDLQIMKEHLMPGIDVLKHCLEMTDFMLQSVIINTDIINKEIYKYLFTVEKVNELVLSGVPFREAYQKVGEEVSAGTFKFDKEIQHTHEGSLGNLQNQQITNKLDHLLAEFQKHFEKVKISFDRLLSD
jgi:argininosuccinate lyase